MEREDTLIENNKWRARILHIIVGIGALFGGMAAILSPSGKAVGISAAEALKHGPFTDFLIPGIFLFVVLGVGNIIAFITAKYKNKYQAYISGCLGVILCLWIIIQCYMLYTINALHIIFFIIGALQIFLSIKLTRNRIGKTADE
ncbi:MAG: hypothetical protein RJR35_01140 [Thermoanaerobacterales bacterium]|nr:hypothetical protein [Thermoanaerobacterales bacterium]